MNNWNQQPPNNDQTNENVSPPRKTGLLSNYVQQNAANQSGDTAEKPRKSGLLSTYVQQASASGNLSMGPAQSAAQVNGSQPASSSSSLQPGQFGPGPGVPPPGQLPRRTGLLTNHRAGIVANTMQAVRSFSGKMAAVAGYRPEPVEPPMERYHPQMGVMAGDAGIIPSSSKSKQWKRSRTTRIVRQMRNRRERWQKSGPSFGRIGASIVIALLLLTIVTSFSSAAYGYTFYQSQLPQVQSLAGSNITQTTRIYDRNGALLYAVSDSNGRRTPVAYKDVPALMQDAQVAAEDGSFWNNPVGINPQAIFRSASTGFGGGSTITQQVIKNLSHNDDHSVQRKASEAALAIGMTQQYPKWKVLEMYFNVAPYGPLNLGIESAAQEYFGLEPQCDQNFKCTPAIARLDYESDANPHDPILAVARASLLAGMPQDPVHYDPRLGDVYKQRALARQDYVLGQMMLLGVTVSGLGKITPTVIQKAEDRTAKMAFTRYKAVHRAPHFVDWVIEQVETALGNGDANAGVHSFLTGGFNIRTTLDINLEEYAEAEVKRHLREPEAQQFQHGQILTLNKDDNVNNAAVIVMNAKDGEVLAMNGAVDYNDSSLTVAGNYNMATTPRQPGSTFKPLIYATAFQMGWYPGIVLPDVKTYFPNGLGAGVPVPMTEAQYSSGQFPYTPTDYGKTYSYNTHATIRYATANSFNVPAVKALQYIGLENATNTATRLGLLDDMRSDAAANKCRTDYIANNVGACYGMSLVLGTTYVSLLHMVNAYQTFANQGSRVPAQGVLDIWDNYGHNLYHLDHNAIKGDQVFSPQVSYMMTSVLSDESARALEFPNDHDLSFADREPVCASDYLSTYTLCQHQVAAKTGTTDDFKDNWTIGYTPNVVVGVWAGNTNAEKMTLGVVGITGAAPIWHSVMEFAANGWCSLRDEVRCPQVNRDSWGLGQATQFTVPDGLRTVCTSADNGLAGGGGRCDWMINGQAPLQQGLAPAPVNPDPNANKNPDPNAKPNG